jgi:hypothetical protein
MITIVLKKSILHNINYSSIYNTTLQAVFNCHP